MTTPIAATACTTDSDLFLDQLLEDPSCATNTADRRRAQMLAAKAAQACAQCPLMAQCLTDAVVKHDVSGFCAGTTQRQRQQIRNLLGWQVEADNLDSFAGVNSGHQINHDEVLRLRQANPTEPLGAIASRLGCSLSTVKRHLRKERRGEAVGRSRLAEVPPSTEQVLEAYRRVVGSPREVGSRAA